MVKKVKHPVMESPKKKGLFRKKEEQKDELRRDLSRVFFPYCKDK